jgi:hypothetical protein
MKINIRAIEQTALMKKHFWFMEWNRILTPNQNMKSKKNINQIIENSSLFFVLYAKREVILHETTNAKI